MEKKSSEQKRNQTGVKSLEGTLSETEAVAENLSTSSLKKKVSSKLTNFTLEV